MNVYECSKVSFSKNGITFYSKKFENGREIKIDQPVSTIKTKTSCSNIGFSACSYLFHQISTITPIFRSHPQSV